MSCQYLNLQFLILSCEQYQDLLQIEKENAKALKNYLSGPLLPWNWNENYCIRGIEPSHKRKVGKLHTAVVLEEQRRQRTEISQGRRHQLDDVRLCHVSERSSSRARRQAVNMAKFDAISGYGCPSSMFDIFNAIFYAIKVNEAVALKEKEKQTNRACKQYCAN